MSKSADSQIELQQDETINEDHLVSGGSNFKLPSFQDKVVFLMIQRGYDYSAMNLYMSTNNFASFNDAVDDLYLTETR